MSDTQPLIALGHTINIERSARRKRRLVSALRAAATAAGFGFVGF